MRRADMDSVGVSSMVSRASAGRLTTMRAGALPVRASVGRLGGPMGSTRGRDLGV